MKTLWFILGMLIMIVNIIIATLDISKGTGGYFNALSALCVFISIVFCYYIETECPNT